MNIKAVLLIGLAMCFARCTVRDQDDCEKKCPVYIQAQGVCFSDGNIYTDECRAQCADKSLKSVSKCRFPFNASEAKRCDEECKQKCVNHCPVYIKAQSICASDGSIYVDECQAKCSNHKLKEVFNCGHLNASQCAEKCEKTVKGDTCVSKCPIYKKSQQICASNGLLYIDECRAQCEDSTLVQLFNCDSKKEGACKRECRTEAKIFTCQSQCPRLGRRLMYWCADDGKVYDDLCKAQCIDKHIDFLWNCEDKNIMPNEKEKCEKLCVKELPCDLKCKNQPGKFVCGRDGKTYRNSCECRCRKKQIGYFIGLESAEEVRKCALRYGPIGGSQ